MKKIISVILCLCLTVGLMSAAFAADTDKMKNVLETVKSRIGSTDEYDEFESSTRSIEDELCMYKFMWYNTENDSRLTVTALEDGVIIAYNLYGKDVEPYVPIFKRASKEQIKTAAEGFIKQLNPDVAESLSVDAVVVDDSSAYAYVTECKNGYPIRNSGGYIRVDATGKRLLSFDIDYIGDGKFQTGEVISKDDAIKNFKEKLGMELCYSVDEKWVNELVGYEKTINPVYKITDAEKYISALNGEVFEPKSSYSPYKNGAYSYSAGAGKEESLEDVYYSDAELDEIDDVEKLISVEKAFEIVKNIKCVDSLNVEFSDVDKSLGRIGKDEKRMYQFNYFKIDNDTATNFAAAVNAENGEVIRFYSNVYSLDYDYGNESKVEISDDKAKRVAEKAIKELAPKKSSEYELDSVDSGICVYVRYVNGIPVLNDRISVAVNPETEKVSSYAIAYTDGEFPDISNVISKSEADDILLKNIEYNIEYIYDGADEEYKLCYVLDYAYETIDPFSGELDAEQLPTVDDYTDVSGHYAEQAAIDLAGIDLGFAGGELKPDEPIKQKEFAALVGGLIRYGNLEVIDDDYDFDSTYEYYADFIAPEEVNPDGIVTRRDAAKFVVRAMGYIDVAKLDIYKSVFKDVTEDVGYINILSGFKIMNGDENGNFNPDGILTRAQTLIIIYNYITK